MPHSYTQPGILLQISLVTQKLFIHKFDRKYLIVDLVPAEQVIDIGRQAHMQCLTEERDRATIFWRKDGLTLSSTNRISVNQQTLQIFNLQREDYGVYQCFVTRGSREVQATAQLRLGGQCHNQHHRLRGRYEQLMLMVQYFKCRFCLQFNSSVCGCTATVYRDIILPELPGLKPTIPLYNTMHRLMDQPQIVIAQNFSSQDHQQMAYYWEQYFND